jgi:type II secretory pathway pseudopilin PulG
MSVPLEADQPVPTRFWIRLAELLITAILAVALVEAWRADRRDRAQLAAELATAKQALAQADAHQHDRDTQLLHTLSTLASEKRAVTTPAQIVRELPNEIPLPAPIVLQPPNHLDSPDAQPSGLNAKSSPAQAVIPAEDLKPLYDFALDCQACQAKLTTSQGDLADEKAKTSVLTKERDQAVQIAKGGTILRRIARATKWLLIGAALGAVASRAAHP